MTRIRPMLATDAEFLSAVERSAAEAFLALPDLAWIARREVDPAEHHLATMDRGLV